MNDNPAMDQPLVSVILTSHNRAGLAMRALDSVLRQTHAHLQIIVVEDGSRTDLYDRMQHVQDPRLQYLCHWRNLGLACARNTGASIASGEWLAFLDDDDLWHPDKIRRQLHTGRRHTEAQAIYCGSQTLDARGRIQAIQMPSVKGCIREALIAGKLTTVPSSLLIGHTTFNRLEGFDEDLVTGIDHDFWFKMAAHGFHAQAVNEPLVIQHETPRGQMTSDYTVRAEGVDAFLRKWQPKLAAWMGVDKARRFAKDYRAYFMCHTCVTSLLKSGRAIHRRRLGGEFCRHPQTFFRHPRFLLALLLGPHAYIRLRRLKARSSARDHA